MTAKMTPKEKKIDQELLREVAHPELYRAIKAQLSPYNMSEFLSTLRDVSRHGGNTGHHGFIYYSDTIDFFKENRAAIRASLRDDAESMGESVFDVVKGFKALRDVDSDAIGSTLYGDFDDSDDSKIVASTLAQYALEAVAYQVENAIENSAQLASLVRAVG